LTAAGQGIARARTSGFESSQKLWTTTGIAAVDNPLYYSCPLGYLKLVPIEQYGGHAEWRELVRKYQTRITEKRRAEKAVRRA